MECCEIPEVPFRHFFAEVMLLLQIEFGFSFILKNLEV
jgi:hypothetical protein